MPVPCTLFRLARPVLLFSSLWWADAHANAPEPPRATPAPTAPVATAGQAGVSRDALLLIADELVRDVSQLRGLAAKAPISRGVLSRDQIVEKLRARIAKEYTPEEVRRESGVLKRLGLMADDVDYEKTLFNLLADQVAGFYDPQARTLYIADWLPVQMQRPALAHEIEHALQDQHFDLTKYSAPMKNEGDAQMARSAVVEGDGTAVMLELPARGARPDSVRTPAVVAKLGKQMMMLTMGATPAFQRAPQALRETLVFPYASGLEFVITHRGADGWSRVDDLFRSPPESTEQVMHPEKYAQREHPVRISSGPLPTLASTGRKEVHRDVMGELVWKIWFGSAMAESQAETAAAGWGGDRMVAYEGPGDDKPIVVSLSAWDSDSDADEAEAAARRTVAALAPLPAKDAAKEAAAPKPPRGVPFFRQRGNQVYGLVRRDRLMAVVLGVPKGAEQSIIEETFRNFHIAWPPVSVTPPAAVPATTPTSPAGTPGTGNGSRPAPWR